MNLKRLKKRLKQRFCKHSCYYEGIEYNFGEPCFSYICEKCGKRIIVKHSAIRNKIQDFECEDCSQYTSEKIALKSFMFPDIDIYHSGRNVGKAVCWYYEKYGILIRAYNDVLDKEEV